MSKNQCEFCSEQKETASTTFTGKFCTECLEIVVEQSLDAIKEIRARKGKG